MKFYLFIAITFLIPLSSTAQKLDTKIYYEQEGDLFSFLADNNELFPVTIIFTFDIANMHSSSELKFTRVLPARSSKTKITVLKPVDISKKFSYSFKTRSLRGDINLAADETYVYDLPYKKGSTYMIFQGYNGAATHKNLNALDFSLKTGDEVYAARSGTVVQVVENNDRNCLRPECADYNNVVIILHEDGTFADYSHLKKNGAIVEEGDVIKTGQVIAYSGNTGYASGPHLHFSVFVPDVEEGMRTLKTKFKTGDGSSVEILQERKAYRKDY